MGVLFPNSTDYVHRDEPNLLNLHKAMEYNEDGKPHLRVTLGSDTITINGDVNVGSEIEISNDNNHPVPVNILNTPLTVNQGTSPWSVSVSNWPSTQAISGSVSISNFPDTQNVSGSVGINNWPVTQAVSGAVSISNLPDTQNVSGSVSISNLPATQAVSGTVNIGNFPVTQGVSGTVNIGNLPSTQNVSGSVSVSNFPSTQNVSGSVSISNLPVNQSVTQGTSPWVISGNVGITGTPTVNIGTIPEVEIKNDIGNPIPVNASISGTVTAAVIPGAEDAFGRLRVSDPTTLGDYHHVSGENPEMALMTIGSGTGAADIATSSYMLSVGTGDGDCAVHQSLMYHHYLPGKSQLINASFKFGTPRTNTVKRTGYFDDRNGIYFQQDGNGTLSFVMRSYVNNAISERVVTQAYWNIDTCSTSLMGADNTAANYGKVGTWAIDASKTQLLMLDFQWLGVGRVRVGFVHKGQFIIAHEFYHSNSWTTIYWTQPSLPIRCEIRNIGTAIGTANMMQICTTVMSEGGYFETGLVNVINSSLTGRIIQNGGGSLPIIAIRLKNTFNTDHVRGIVRAKQIGIVCTNGPIYYQLRRFDSHTLVTGGTWVSFGDDSIIEYNITATGYSGGVAVSGDFVSAAASKSSTASGSIENPVANKRGYITQNYDSTNSGCYALIATALGNANNIAIEVYGSLQWSETR